MKTKKTKKVMNLKKVMDEMKKKGHDVKTLTVAQVTRHIRVMEVIK